MRLPVIRPLSGVCNGVNTVFVTPSPYLAGSVRVWLNGELLRADLENGWVELGESRIAMKVPPVAGDALQAYYVPN